jgi:hypothetical protein
MIRSLSALMLAALAIPTDHADGAELAPEVDPVDPDPGVCNLFELKQFATGAGADHENTTTEGSMARKIFGLGELTPGKIYGFECGVIVSDNNSSDTCTLLVRFGSSSTVTSNTAIATTAAVDSADGDVAYIRGTIHVQSPTRYVFHVTAPDADAVMTIADKSTVVVFVATADTVYYLDVCADWSVAHADNEVAAESFAVWEIC